MKIYEKILGKSYKNIQRTVGRKEFQRAGIETCNWSYFLYKIKGNEKCPLTKYFILIVDNPLYNSAKT